MRPNFALKLSHDGISLLLRATGGWRVVGEVSLDDPELATTLRYLRRTATEMAGGQFATKLIIPNSQILFRDVFAPGDTPGARRVAVRAALDGTTPYALDDLAFDWSDAGNDIAKVAVVASITLEEAEAFATEHRFNPVSFVAMPEPGDFKGEPWFGTTMLAKGLLAADETVERDDMAVTIIGPAQASAPPVDPETLSEQAEDIFSETAEPVFAHRAQPAPLTLLNAGPSDPVDAAANDEEQSSDKHDPPADDAVRPVKTDPTDTSDTSASDTAHPAPTFASHRAATDGLEAAPLRLENIVPRIALRAEGTGSAETAELPDLGKASVDARVTHLPVTAAETADDKRVVKPGSISALPPLPPKAPIPGVAAFAPASPPPVAKDERTVFGARKPARPRGRRRYLGLILTLALLAALLVAGLLANFVLGDQSVLSRLFGPAQPTAIEATEPDTAPQIDSAETEPEPETGIGLAEAEAEHAQTGIWPFAPTATIDPDSDRIDDLYIASIDPVVVGHDAVALPEADLASPDTVLPTIQSPLPPGTRFEFDDDGFVRATPEGALTPEGVVVFAGKPPVSPAVRPGTAPAVAATTAVAEVRPRRRPENLIEQNERSRFGGITRAQLAALRPAPRPASAQDETASTDAAPTELAVLTSPAPANRPSDFSRIVEKAIAEAQSSAPTATADTAGSTVQASATVAAPKLPSVPTRASVAKEATVKNAINLGKINLIGVYGSSANRRALIRLSSGRYVKVQVGDSVDGGQVAAIGSSEVIYIKRGRKVTLEMPKS